MTTLKLKEPNILNKSMNFKNIFKKKSGSSWSYRNRSTICNVPFIIPNIAENSRYDFLSTSIYRPLSTWS